MTAIGCQNSKSRLRRLRLACALIFFGVASRAIAADIDPSELAARRQKIAEMSEFERRALTEKQAKFLAMPAAEQEAMRRLNQELEADMRGDGSLEVVL